MVNDRRIRPRLTFRPSVPGASWPALSLPGPLHYCLLCDGRADHHALCTSCRADLPRNSHNCRLCALPLPQGQPLCSACLQDRPAQDLTIAPLRYEFPVDHLVSGLKYHRRLEHADLLGQILLNELQAQDMSAPDLILPVPLHRQRLAERGYNQALEIARPLLRHFGMPAEIRLLIRQRATAAQMKLDAQERARNPHGAFALDEKRLAELGTLKRVAIIDDVMTTGATLAEITRLLRTAGIPHLELWVVARTP